MIDPHLSPPEAPRPVSLDLDSPELAAAYDATSLHQLKHGKLLIADLSVRPGQRALDVGCGTGRLGAHVAELVGPTGEVIGIDPLPLRVELASRKHPRLRAQVGRAEDLSAFDQAEFDLVFANSVFHWVEDQPRAVREAFRVLRSGGKLGLNSADAERPHQSSVLFRQAMIEAGVRRAAAINTHGPPHRIGATRLREQLDAAGFVDLRVENRVVVDEMESVDAFLSWMNSSTFGNFLLELSSDERSAARELLAEKLEPLRAPTGIRLERYLVVATARKP